MKMKILVYIEKSDIHGGIEVFAERHVAELRAEGHEVTIANDARRGTADESHVSCPASKTARVSRLSSHVEEKPPFGSFDEIIVHKCSDVKTLAAFPPEKTVYYVHDHEPICPRTYAYTPLGRNCTRPGGVWPCIFCAPACRNWRPALARVFAQGRRRRIMARFRKIVVISEFMKSRLVANGIDSGKIEVRPPVIAPAAVTAGSAGPAVDLLYVGQLIRGKGVQLLLQAMAALKSPRTLDIVGTGNMEPKLRALAARLGLADRVRFNGFQPNPQDWMRRAACVVVPSFWQEPYGLVAAEAVALGRPVVAFAVGGLPEACGGKAKLVPPGDVRALAAALEMQK